MRSILEEGSNNPFVDGGGSEGDRGIEGVF